ncbi:hypothetical protein ASD91_13370 [Pseudomonas sp. Root68]|nr:hypothetical protein ASD91_13370 [Pseudomonas sp. Root68]KRB72219.1 hypothetical protein ASD95_02730 [Pseudomonas sp. Root71]
MSIYLRSVCRVAHTIRIRIQPALPKRAPTIRAVKPHQHRVKRPITIPQQITPRHWIRSFAVEAEQAEQTVLHRAMAIRRVGHGVWPSDIKYIQHRTLLISGKQVRFHGPTLTLLLSQQLILMLHDRTLHSVLNLGGQTIFQVKASGGGLRRGSAINQTIQRVVVVAAEQRFSIGEHGRGS